MVGVFVVMVGCGSPNPAWDMSQSSGLDTSFGESDEAESDGGWRAVDGLADSDVVTDAVTCCPISELPTCSSMRLGGTDWGSGCWSLEDAPPVGWTRSIDEQGCPVWVCGGECGTGSCLSNWGGDTGSVSDSDNGNLWPEESVDVGPDDDVRSDGSR